MLDLKFKIILIFNRSDLIRAVFSLFACSCFLSGLYRIWWGWPGVLGGKGAFEAGAVDQRLTLSLSPLIKA